MDLRQVESVGIKRASNELSELLRRVQTGTHLTLLRFDRPVAVIISHVDYLCFAGLSRRDSLAKALLQGKGHNPDMTEQEFLDLLATDVKEGSNAGR